MYLDFKDVCIIVLKSIAWTIIICLFFGLCIFNYNLGVLFCNYMNIPKDLALTIMSPGMAVEVSILLFAIESIILFFIIKYLIRIKLFNLLCEFLCIDI